MAPGGEVVCFLKRRRDCDWFFKSVVGQEVLVGSPGFFVYYLFSLSEKQKS